MAEAFSVKDRVQIARQPFGRVPKFIKLIYGMIEVIFIPTNVLLTASFPIRIQDIKNMSVGAKTAVLLLLKNQQNFLTSSFRTYLSIIIWHPSFDRYVSCFISAFLNFFY